MAQPQLKNTEVVTPKRVADDTKPESGRLTANAIIGFKPRNMLYELTDSGSAGSAGIKLHNERIKILVFSILLAQ